MKNYVKIWAFNLIGLLLVLFISFITLEFGFQIISSIKDMFFWSFFIDSKTFMILVLSIAGSMTANVIYKDLDKDDFSMYQLFYDGLTFFVFSYVVVWIMSFFIWVLIYLFA